MDQVISTPRKKGGLRIKPSTKLVLGAAILAGGTYGVWTYGVGYWILSKHFEAIRPGKVTLLGIRGEKTYQIMVSNRSAQLVEAKDADFTSTSNDSGGDSAGEAEGASKKRVPVKEMLQALNGDEAGLSKFVSILNGLEPNDNWPARRIVWQASDIKKALDGDPAMLAKLEKDINVHLNGRPLPQLSISALENGIIVDTPIVIRVMVGSELRSMTAHVQRPYKPQLLVATEGRFEKLFNITDTQRVGYYIDEAKKLDSAKGSPEDVRGSLTKLIDPKALGDVVERTEKLLANTVVVLSDSYIKDAKSEKNISNGSTTYDIDINVTDEGRLRLWQYSKQHPKDQLLLISNGIAIAAPRIRHELVTKDLSIVQIADEGLVEEAVNSINQSHVKK